MPEQYYGYSLDFGGVSDLTQLAEDVTNYDYDEFSEYNSNDVLPSILGATMVKNQFGGNTPQIKTILDLCNTNAADEGLCRGFSAESVFQLQSGPNKSARALPATTVHLRERYPEAFLCWESITAPESGLATIGFQTDFLGTPTRDTGQALTAKTPTDQKYELGPAKWTIGATLYDPCIDSWTWNNNINKKQRGCSGSDYLAYSAIRNAKPQLTIRTEDIPDVWQTNSMPALASGVAYLRAVDGAGAVADGTPSHIKLTVNSGRIRPSSPTELIVDITSFTIDTASTIT